MFKLLHDFSKMALKSAIISLLMVCNISIIVSRNKKEEYLMPSFHDRDPS